MNELLKLKDIKGNIPLNNAFEIGRNIWIIILIAAVFALFLGAFILIKRYHKIKKEKLLLFNLINNPKKFAYEFTKKAKKYKNKKNEHLLEKIISRLKEYKYKPVVEDIDEKTIQLVKQYLEIK